MYRNYEEYLTHFQEFLSKNAPAGARLKKKTIEEFLADNYRDKIEWYLMEEWETPPFHDIFYGDIDFSNVEENDEMTEEEILADEINDKVYDIIENGREKGLSIPQTAKKVLDYLSKNSIL